MPVPVRKSYRILKRTSGILCLTALMFYYQQPSEEPDHNYGRFWNPQIPYPYRSTLRVNVSSELSFSQNTALFNAVLSKIYTSLVSDVTYILPNETIEHVVWEGNDDFINRLQHYRNYPRQVNTTVLTWLGAQRDTATYMSGVPLTQVYTWIGSPHLCRRFWTGHFTFYYDVIYNRSCESRISKGIEHTVLQTIAYWTKTLHPAGYWPNGGRHMPRFMSQRLPPHVTYMNIIKNAVVTSIGNVLTGNIKVTSLGCDPDRSRSLPWLMSWRVLYDDVFVATQPIRHGFSDMILQILPRIALYVPFLRKHREVKIHLGHHSNDISGAVLKLLGLEPGRVTSGVVRARRVYLPPGTPCGLPRVHNTQELARLCAERLTRTPQDTLLLVTRTSGRAFRSDVTASLRQVATRYGLDFRLFRGDPAPPLLQAARTFHRACVVVAPHGGALANLLFAQPGAVVIEGLRAAPHTDLRYQRLAHVLGLRYYGLQEAAAQTDDVINVSAQSLAEVTETYLSKMGLKVVENN